MSKTVRPTSANLRCMASISKRIALTSPVEEVWSALRDWGALHERLAVGFVTDTRREGEDRIVTFFEGTVLRERLVTLDEESRRLVWSIVDGPYSHHNGVAHLHEDEAGGTLFVWDADLLPDAAAPRTAQMMEAGLAAIKRTLDG
jgi:hypothetical protein